LRLRGIILNFPINGRAKRSAPICLLLFAAIAAGQGSSPSIEGEYVGQLGQFRLLLHVRDGGPGNLAGTLDNLDQRGANGIRCKNVLLSGTQLTFEVPEVKGTFRGEFSSDGNTITGTWTQGPSVPLKFIRQASNPEPAKDLAPKTTFQFAGVSRTYYFFIPDSEGPLPIVVLLHGSGRSGEVMVDAWKALATKEHFILVAPDSFESSGWSGKMDSPDFFHAVVDQVAGKHAIDVNRVYLFGHSAGAVHALVLALIDSNYYAATAVHAGALPSEYESLLFARATRRMPIQIWVGDKDPLFPVDTVSRTKRLFDENGFHAGLSIVPNHDHNYYAISEEIDAQAWDFFEKAGSKSSIIDGKFPINSALNRQLTAAPGEATSYFQLPIQKLKGAVPALKGIRYDPSQEQLPWILDHVAKTIADLLPRLPDLISREDVHHFQESPDHADMSVFSQGVFQGIPDRTAAGGLSAAQPWSQEFKFLLQCQRKADGSMTISELRIDSQGKLATDTGMRSHGAAYQWLLFSDASQSEFRFRLLGQQEKSGYKTFAIAFMQDPHGVAEPAYFQSQGRQEPFYYQGVVWVDQSSFNIVALRTDLLAPLPDLKRLTTELTFRSVPIHGYDAVFWLPCELDISIDQGAGPVEESHRYSDYHLFHAQARIVASP
jgi:predicted esterase